MMKRSTKFILPMQMNTELESITITFSKNINHEISPLDFMHQEIIIP